MSFAYVENNIEAWGYTKGILGPNGFGTAEGQVLKTLEETNELIDAITNNNREEIIDAIGDIGVTLLMQCVIQGVTLTQCLEAAYEVISKRKGKMIDGVFVKD